MRLSKIQVVATTLVCLVLSGAAQGQFGKLKSLAKDKLGMPGKPAPDQESLRKGPAGEAKATFAPGVSLCE